MRAVISFILIVGVASCTWAFEIETLTGVITRVIDGDTFILDGEKRIKLHGIDCPELGQPFGQTARMYAAEALVENRVRVFVTGIDRYKRIVGEVWYINEATGEEKPFSISLVLTGLAWVRESYCLHELCGLMVKCEKSAQKTKVGLWIAPNPIPPWEWRKTH